MAIVFELVVNFGSDDAAVDAARDLVLGHAPLEAGPHGIALHPPLVRTARSLDGSAYAEMSVLPAGVGFGAAVDRGHEQVRLTAAAFTGLGEGLYRLLAGFGAYRAAKVGWDVEGFVDPAELRSDWAEELAAGELPGLVLAEDLVRDLGGGGFVPFAPGHAWIPYAGEPPSTLTTDRPAG